MSFFITFGQDHVGVEGSQFPQAHPDGWLTIDAPSEETARFIAFGLLERRWSMIYPTKPSLATYPRGELGRVSLYIRLPREDDGTESGVYLHTETVNALHLTPETTEDQLTEFDRDFRVPGWMRDARGWLVRHTDTATTRWVHPADFAYDYEPIPEAS